MTDSGSNTVSVIDTGTNTVTATIPVGPGPQWLAVSPGVRPAGTTLSCTPGTSGSGDPVDVCTVGDPDGIRTVRATNTDTDLEQFGERFDCSDAPVSLVFTVPAGTKYRVIVVDCNRPRNRTPFVIRADGDVLQP